MSDSIDESSPDSPDIPDSGFDGGPSLNLINTESVADLEGFRSLNILDGVPQVEKHRNYKFRTRPTKMADNLQESSSEDLFVESESDFLPGDDESESESEYEEFEFAKAAPHLKKSNKGTKGVLSDTRFPIKERWLVGRRPNVGGRRPNYKLKGNVGNEDNNESETDYEESEVVKAAPKLKNS